MLGRSLRTLCLVLLYWTGSVLAGCDSYSPAFHLPNLSPDDPVIRNAFKEIKLAVELAFDDPRFNKTSYSLEVTSPTQTLFELHRTAQVKDDVRPGAKVVNGRSCYRIASNTKSFTVLAILQQVIKGNLNLDDPINMHIPELGEKSGGGIPWKDISIRTLASQLSGIPRDMSITDLLADIANFDHPEEYGLPPVSWENMTECDALLNTKHPCTAKDLFNRLDRGEPIFPPKQESTYSNLNFELLGLALANVAGMPYTDYVTKHILEDLDMSSTSFSTPDDSVSVMPKGDSSYWDIDIGVQKPTGGLYSSSADMAKFARYVLTHYNGLTPAVNWFNPISYATGVNSFYGMPWEIFRTTDMIPYTQRPITFVNKGGGLPGYSSMLTMMPEYGIGFFAVVAGDGSQFDKMLNIVRQNLVTAAESIAHQQTSRKHVGAFVASEDLKLNSSIAISHSPAKGLYISSWISNSTDTLQKLSKVLIRRSSGHADLQFRFQLVPTLLYKDEANQRGEIWRILPVTEGEVAAEGDRDHAAPPFSDYCITDIDFVSYGGLPLTEVVFWSEDKDGVYQEFELTGFRVKLDRVKHSIEGAGAGSQIVIGDKFSTFGSRLLNRLH